MVPREVYKSCDFTNKTNQLQLAIARWIRADTYLKVEPCSIGIDGCNGTGWTWNEYPHDADGGGFRNGEIRYILQVHENWNDLSNLGCLNEIRLRVYIDQRMVMPLTMIIFTWYVKYVHSINQMQLF